MNTVAARFSAERRFYVGAAVGIVVVLLAGFSVDLDLLRDMSPLSALVRVHGAVMLGWVALFVTQTGLIARRHVGWHRRLGILGACLAGVVVIAGSATAVVAARLGGDHLPPGIATPVFIARSASLLLAFAILVGSALVVRRQSAWHKRFMLLATLQSLTPGGSK